MKAKNKYLEKAISALSDELYEEAAEHALAGIKQTKNNKKTPRLNKMFARILSCAAIGLKGEIEPAMEGDALKCSSCDKNEHDKVKLMSIAGVLICNECSELISKTFKEIE